MTVTDSAPVRKGVFWWSVVSILYVYVGFPILIAVRAALFPKAVHSAPIEPNVSLIIAAHNESQVISVKLDNAAQIDYPPDRLQIIVASDGSTDGTVARIEAHHLDVTVLDLPRRGKNPTLNTAVEHATGEILVFSDADSELEPAAIRALVAPFADPEVGGVVGNFRYRVAERGRGEQRYLDVDRLTKRLQSRGGSVTSATGQLHAVRRAHWVEIPPGVADDSFTSVGVNEAHHRLVFAEDAVATGAVEENTRHEYGRKSRYIGRGFTSLWMHRSAFNPVTHGFYSLQLFSHKVLRRLVVLPIIALFLTSLALWRGGPIYRLAASLQIGFHGLAAIGWAFRDRRDLPRVVGRLADVALYFDMLNIAVLKAMVFFLSGKRRDVWIPQRPEEGE